MPAPPLTIGVFDSGFGGLTVLRELLDVLPSARFLYLGDSARLPYGSKSPETVARFAVSSARFLLGHGADLLVIACNTATALALPAIEAAAAPVPVLGVVQPGAEAAASLATLSLSSTAAQRHPLASTAPAQNSVISTEAQRSGETRFSNPNFPPHVLVLATPATVASHAYSRALEHLGLASTEKACPLLVPLVEEGWTDHPVTAEVARIYLAEALAAAPSAAACLLGCTHYPLLKPLLARTLAQLLGRLGRPAHLPLIDSAQTTAAATARTVSRLLEHTGRTGLLAALAATPATPDLHLFATDSVEKFQQLGSRFLARPLPPVHLVALDD